MPFAVDGAIALVTGANRGIGRAIVESLFEHRGAKIYLGVRDPRSADDLADKYGQRVEVLTIDLTLPQTIIDAARHANDVNLVINNAGVLMGGHPLAENAIDHLATEIDVNVYGLIRMAQAFASVLAANGGGAFVQLNSVASLKSYVELATYAASKAAAYSITQALRAALRDQNTLVVSVHPGPIDTDMARDAGMIDTTEPPAIVAEAMIRGLAKGEFHVFPDSVARAMWQAYEGFARLVVEDALADS